jgi:hypothetical protein
MNMANVEVANDEAAMDALMEGRLPGSSPAAANRQHMASCQPAPLGYTYQADGGAAGPSVACPVPVPRQRLAALPRPRAGPSRMRPGSGGSASGSIGCGVALAPAASTGCSQL